MDRRSRAFCVQPPAGGAIGKYLRTLRYLKSSQIVYQLRNRLLPITRTFDITGGERRRTGVQYLPFVRPEAPNVDDAGIEFLGKRRRIDPQAMDWQCPDEAKLWRYNLHYFDYLHWDKYSSQTKGALIEDWIRSNPVGTQDAWEAYPVSLRCVNWIKYLLTHSAASATPSGWQTSLARQLAWLEANLEHHLLANHLLKNAKALVFSGVFFCGDMAERHLAKGLRLLTRQVAEQMLPDGGHFERSPMYHCIVLEDLIDVVNLLRSNPSLADRDRLLPLELAASRGMRFLASVVGADGNIALFNDSAFGIAASPAALLAYGRRVLNPPIDVTSDAPIRVCLPDSGYFGGKCGEDSLLLDCGPIGPEYQPGHGHCDTLSYELCIDGRRVVVDSGVHDYEMSDLRQFVRSTAAHNTVRIDGLEQSEIWGAFRVARRARPIFAELGQWSNGSLEFRGAHGGYCRLPGRPVHERRVRMTSSGLWSVSDTVTGRGEHTIESYIHLHPDLTIRAQNDSEFAIHDDDRQVAWLRVNSRCEATTVAGVYCPRFGLALDNTVLILRLRGELPLSMDYSITKV